MTTTPRSRQEGASLLAIIYILFTLGVILWFVILSVPIYMNNRDIQQAIDQVASDSSLTNASPIRIQNALGRRFDAGYVDGVRARELTITSNGAQRVISLDYTVKRPFFHNIGLTFHFDDSAVMGSASN